MKKIISLFLFLFLHFTVFAGNLSFSFGDIAHILDVSPSFVSQAGGTVIMSFEVTWEKDYQIGSDLQFIINGNVLSSGIVCSQVRKAGGSSDYANYEAQLEIGAITVEEFRREISFRGAEDRDGIVVLQGGETLQGTISGSNCENMFPGQRFDILVSNAEIGAWYTLYRCEGAEMVEIETKIASKSTFYFSLVDCPGTYVVGNGASWCEGVVHAYEAVIFSPDFFNSGYSGDIELPADGGVYSGTLEAKDEIPIEVTEFYLGMLSGEFTNLWSEYLGFTIVGYSNDHKRLYYQIVCGPNISNVPRVGDTQFVYKSGNVERTIKFVQPAGGVLRPYRVSSQTNTGRTALTVHLSGSQPMVMYYLRDDQGARIRSMSGTGSPLRFEGVDTMGVYTVLAYYEDMENMAELEMLGKAQMPVILPGFDDEDPQEPENYVRNYTFTSADQDYTLDATYYNGLGYPLQTVLGHASGDGRKNIITPIYYDNMLNPDVHVCLPYADEAEGVRMGDNPEEAQRGFYDWLYGPEEGEYAYVANDFEASSRTRILRSMNAGRVFRNHMKYKEHSYRFNADFEVCDDANEFYAAGALLKHTVKNEDGNLTVEFRDITDRIRLQQDIDTEGNIVRDVHYTYNHLDRLSSVSTGFLYEYDSLGRVAERRLPGGRDEIVFYDDEDRIIYRGTRGTHFKYEYDDFGRIANVYAKPSIWYSYFSMNDSLSRCAPGEHPILNFGGTLISSYEYGTTRDGELAFQPVEGVVSQSDVSEKIRGLKTYEKQLIVQDSMLLAEFPEYVERAYYYDYRGRVIQRVEKTHLGSILRTSYKYDFVGNTLVSDEQHTKADEFDDGIRISYVYDSRNRITQESAEMRNGASSLVTCEYDDLGRLSRKTYYIDDRAVTETYDYNMQGWQTRRQSEYFDQQLIYYDTVGLLPTSRLFSGNIAGIQWQHKAKSSHAYVFQYDGQDRLLSANLYDRNSDIPRQDEYSEYFDYYPDGNVKAVRRYNVYSDSVDDISFAEGNCPNYLTDHAHDDVRYALSFDERGNLIRDEYNNLELSYNFLNLVSRTATQTESEGAVDYYTYLADGTKCALIGNYDAGYDYIGSLVYRNNGGSRNFDSAPFGSGRFRAVTGEGSWQAVPLYFLQDHLGSTRVVISGSEPDATYDYYPYGMLWADAGHPVSDNNYLFNGKEWQAQDAINMYDYGARFYQPRYGRWLAVDPLAEKYYSVSPYAYCAGNPVNHIDYEGRLIGFYVAGRSGDIVNIPGDQDLSSVGYHYLGSDDATVGEIRDNYAAYQARQEKGKAMISIFSPDNVGAILGIAMGVGEAPQRTMHSVRRLATSTSSGVWKLHPLERGWAIEKRLSGWGNNFPVIDKFEKGIATSIKSLDLNAPTYQKTGKVFNTLKGYIDDLARFNGAKWKNINIQSSNILGKQLDLALPFGSGSAVQWEQIQRAMKYALQNNITMTINFIK